MIFYIVVLIGDSACGKTNLLTRFARNEFSSDTRSTIGVEFMSKLIKVESGKHAQIQVWYVLTRSKIQRLSVIPLFAFATKHEQQTGKNKPSFSPFRSLGVSFRTTLLFGSETLYYRRI